LIVNQEGDRTDDAICDCSIYTPRGLIDAL